MKVSIRFELVSIKSNTKSCLIWMKYVQCLLMPDSTYFFEIVSFLNLGMKSKNFLGFFTFQADICVHDNAFFVWRSGVQKHNCKKLELAFVKKFGRNVIKKRKFTTNFCFNKVFSLRKVLLLLDMILTRL